MLAKIYELRIVDGPLDAAHGISHPVRELYIYDNTAPELVPLDVGVNLYQGELHVIEYASDTGRYAGAVKVKDLEWSEEIALLSANLRVYLGLRATAKERAEKIMGEAV